MNEILKCLQERRSVRQFLPTQIASETLDAIVTAAAYAPSGMGRQPCRIVVLQNRADIDELEQLNAALLGAPGSHPFYGAPTVCVVFADSASSTAVEDGSLVLGNMMNAAYSLGVGSCWIHRARQTFQLPEGKALMRRWGIAESYIGVGHCILGYAAQLPAPANPRRADFVVRV